MSGLERGFYAKLDSHLCRITLLLHVLRNPANPRTLVDVKTLCDAIAITEVIESHFHKCLAAYTPARTKTRLELRILRILEETHGGDWINRADLIHALGNVQSPTLSETLSRMSAEGIIESRKIDGSGAKPIEQWRICTTDQLELSNYSNFQTESYGTSKTSNGSHIVAFENPLAPTGTDDEDPF
jgi:DNA-binding HxlR family transcriptional regulator